MVPDISRPRAVGLRSLGVDTALVSAGSGRWTGADVEVELVFKGEHLHVSVSAPTTPLDKLVIRWPISVPASVRVLGDAWERGYGDLGWRSLPIKQEIPWYLAWHSDGHTHAAGVATGCSALASWRISTDTLELQLDLRSGNRPLRLGKRRLEVAQVVTQTSKEGESPFNAIGRFCHLMSPKVRPVSAPVYGVNDWYYAYGANTGDGLLRDAERASSWAGDSPNRPFCVIDAGWQPEEGCGGGPWDHGNKKFGDMAALAEGMRKRGCRPGIWIRPLLSDEKLPDSWYFKKQTLDPSVPGVIEKVKADIARCHEWGYQLIKHDFSTWDCGGLWGFEMTDGVFAQGPSFSDGTRTTAEILKTLYHAIREAAGDSYLIGCNTIGHLSAGTHEIQRIGDDTSGREWSRTRKMGVNSLAFRGVQQGSFFDADADCVGLTKDIPWELNHQWLRLVAGSGTPLFVSAAPDAVGPEQEKALKEAFHLASKPQAVAEPVDWMETLTPSKWHLRGEIVEFDWGQN